MNNNIHIISSENNWMEQTAINQLSRISCLEGMKRVIGLPDLHPGKTPVGAVFVTEDMIYPHIIGSDIGCGMSLFQTDIEKRKMRLDKWVKRLEAAGSLKEAADPLKEIDILRMVEGISQDLSCPPLLPHHECLGTIGGGNHFAEFQETDTIFDPVIFAESGLDKGRLMLLIHTGSRSYGQEIVDEFLMKHNAKSGLSRKSESASLYLTKHDSATSWASLNRRLVASRFLAAMGADSTVSLIIDSGHNSIETKKIGNKDFFIHRKGAAPADQGIIAIPGSRGALTYLVMPCSDTSASGWSVAHGAGRKWERSVCKPRLKDKYTRETITTTRLKSRVICHRGELLFEEAPEAYKNIDHVIESMVDAGLVKVIATMKPVLTYKN